MGKIKRICGTKRIEINYKETLRKWLTEMGYIYFQYQTMRNTPLSVIWT